MSCDLPKERLPSNSSTRADEIKASYASELEAYSHNQGLFVVERFERHSDGGRVSRGA